MGFFDRIFGRRRRVQRDMAEAVSRARALLAAGDAAGAWDASRAALVVTVAPESLAVAADSLARVGERQAAELFAHAAQAPHDVGALLELGSQLTSLEVPDVALAVLERALELAPFDAVVRSELGLAQARLGKTADVLETLALHPCLADDPGALLLFAWCAMLTGDLVASESALAELRQGHGDGPLPRKLSLALARARVEPFATPPCARDYYFIEYAGLVLDGSARAAVRAVDGQSLALWAALARTALAGLGVAPARVMAATEHALDLARDISGGADVAVVPSGDARLPHGLVVALDAADLEPLTPRLHAPRGETLTFAAVLRWDRTVARAPDLVGALVRAPRWDAHAPDPTLIELDASELRGFIEARREHLPPRGERVAAAYVPDAPLPWP